MDLSGARAVVLVDAHGKDTAPLQTRLSAT